MASGSRHTANASGTVASAPFNVSWSFVTAALKPLTVTASSSALAAAPGSTVDVRVDGGTGRYLSASTSIGYGYYAPTGLADLAAVANVATGMIRLTRGATQWSGALTACHILIRGADSASTVMTLDLPIR